MNPQVGTQIILRKPYRQKEGASAYKSSSEIVAKVAGSTIIIESS